MNGHSLNGTLGSWANIGDLESAAPRNLESTHVEVVDRSQIVEAVVHNSLYYDGSAAWRKNLHLLEHLVDVSEWYSLAVGMNPAGISEAANSILSDYPAFNRSEV